MSLKVERLQQESIVLATLTGTVTPELITEMYAQSAALADEIGGHVYRITDVRECDISFSDLLLALAEASEGQPGSPTDPRITGMLVGTNQMSLMFSKSAEQDQYHNMNIPHFNEMDQAMAYIREQMANG